MRATHIHRQILSLFDDLYLSFHQCQLLIVSATSQRSSTQTCPSQRRLEPAQVRLRQLLHERPSIRIGTERIIDRIHNPLDWAYLPKLLKLPHSEECTRRAPDIHLPHPIERRIVA